MRLQNRAGGAHGDLEALPRARVRVAVEQDRDLVAGRVLELLHHQPAAARGRAPVHLAQRLALRVLAHAVQLVAGRPAEQQPPPVLRMRAALGEEPVERDEPRVDDERLRLALLERRPRETERILDRQPDGLERVPAAWHLPQLVAAREPTPADPVKLDPAFVETSRPLVRDERRRRQRAGRSQLEVDANVVALDDVARRAVAADERRASRETHPADRERDGEEQPGRDGVERARAEHPGHEVDEEAEGEDRAPALRQCINRNGVFSSASATIAVPPSPAERASGPRMSRWERTDGATALTSSGTR